MSKLDNIISSMKGEWSIPRFPSDEGEDEHFKLGCFFYEREKDLKTEFPFKLPEDLISFWSKIIWAEIFKDVDSGQWGLEIFSPDKALKVTSFSRKERPSDFKPMDLVIGKFIGDSDLLVVSCYEKQDFGRIMVALPLDERKEWYVVADKLSDFLELYYQNEGKKFWEVGIES